MQKKIEHNKEAFLEEINVKGLEDLKDIEIRYLGRKGVIHDLTKNLKELPAQKRALAGKEINELKSLVKKEIDQKKLQATNYKLQTTEVDVTLPGKKAHRGHLHPLTLIQDRMVSIFKELNFSVAEGPEVESEKYNFDSLNIPPNHPARDMWQTFWLRPQNDAERNAERRGNFLRRSASSLRESAAKLLLRTHTSPVQIRFMEKHNPPLRIIAPGRVFRYEASDATHDFQFYQLEGLMVDRRMSIANFKAVIEVFFKRMFGKDFGGMRLRPSYFPFTEPSFEVDFYWKRKEKWLELMGAGMVHPNVFEAAGFAQGEWQGFAFGMGIDRIAMMKYNIPDVRLFYSGDLRFIWQF